MRKLKILVSEQIRHKMACTVRSRLEPRNFGFKKMDCTNCIAKIKKLITVAVQLQTLFLHMQCNDLVGFENTS